MKRLLRLSIIPLSMLLMPLTTNAEVETNYEEKLPYMFKEPNWEKYTNGDKGSWPIPEAPPYSTGLYSLSSVNAVDYKEDKNKYFETASKYKSSGNLEVYYESNTSTAINASKIEGGVLKQSIGGDAVVEFNLPKTNVAAYNSDTVEHQLVLDNSQGQWLITNGIYSRNNLGNGIRRTLVDNNNVVHVSAIDSKPWQLLGQSEFIKPEDFLMGVSKAVYGVEQSRPIYFQETPNRLARKVTWYVENPRRGRDSCGPITWTYKAGDWKVQDVSYINKGNSDVSAPACGTAKTIDRGEYIVHPNGYLNNVWYRYFPDQNSFVSANVYELYLTRLLQKGIITTDNTFANIKTGDAFEPNVANANNFSLDPTFGLQFYREYRNYGRINGGEFQNEYPVWAPELGALYTNPELVSRPLGSNTVDKNINITQSGGSDLVQRVLGVQFKVSGDSQVGPRSVTVDTNRPRIMTKNTVTLINALKVIETAMRVEHGDMTESEANIITRKYGAQYLDVLSESDKRTVSYLLAKGVLNFENYQEYSNIYSPLTESFAYKLLYRVANKEARLKFSEVTLTDSSDIPSDMSEYKNNLFLADLTSLNEIGSLLSDGSLTEDGTKPLNLISDVDFFSEFELLEESKDKTVDERYEIKVHLDTILKYTYRGMPLVNLGPEDSKYKGLAILKPTGGYEVYSDPNLGLHNDIEESAGRYVGIKSVRFDINLDRYEVVFVVYGDSYQSAVEFIRMNLETRISKVTTKKEETSMVSETGSTYTKNTANQMNSSISTNSDITVNKDLDNLSAVSNSTASVVGNTVVYGPPVAASGTSNLTSTDFIANIDGNTTHETIGQKGVVSIPTRQMSDKYIFVRNDKGLSLGKTSILQQDVSSKPVTGNAKEFKYGFTGYNISLFKSADTLIKDYAFEYTDKNGDPAKVGGTVLVSWELDLPTEKEQASLVGLEVSPYTSDGARGSWIFTRPVNKALAEVWNYNVGLNNALLKTISGNPLNIPSGYFAPQVTILIDSVSSQTIDGNSISSKDLRQEQIREIKNKFLAEVSNNFTQEWVRTYIGDINLANHVIDKNGNKNVSDYIDAKKSDGGHTFIKTQGMLGSASVPLGEVVWGHLVFNSEPDVDTAGTTYFNKHKDKANLDVYTIFSTINGNHYYGNYHPGSGEGDMERLNIPFAKGTYNSIFRNIDNSEYQFNSRTNTLKANQGSQSLNYVGKTLNYNDRKWRVASADPYTLGLYSQDLLTGIVKDDKVVLSTSGDFTAPNIVDAVHSMNLKEFGSNQEAGIKSSMYMRTYAFDLTPPPEQIPVDTKFLGIKNGNFIPYIYEPVITNDKIDYKLVEQKLVEGETIYVPQFVVLSRAVWSANSTDLYWSKKFVGANEELYNPGDLVQSMKEQLLPSSSQNIVLSNEIKSGTLVIGGMKGKIEEDQVTFTVPFKSEMIKDDKLDTAKVEEEFTINSDLTLVNGGNSAAATQYLENKTVGAYNPNYDLYHNTLVLLKGALKVATANELVDYTPTSVIDSVSITAELMEGLKLLNFGSNAALNQFKIYQYQDVEPPTTISPFTDGAPPILNADGSTVPDTAVRHEGLSSALELFDSIKKELRDIAARDTWNLIIISCIAIALALSLTTLLSHILAESPISNVFFTKFRDVTGIDLLTIMSLRAVSVDGDNSWIRSAKHAIALGILPSVAFGLMVLFGVIK